MLSEQCCLQTLSKKKLKLEVSFVENISENDFNNFTEENQLGSLLQTSEWGNFKKKCGWRKHLVGLKVNGKIVIQSLLLSRKLPIVNKYFFYAPRGFLGDYNHYFFHTFIIELKKYLTREKAVSLTIDPPIKLNKLNLLGEVLEKDVEGENILNILCVNGFRHKGFPKSFENIQARYNMRIDLTPSIEDIFKNMKQKTRYNISLAKRKGIEIKEGKREDLKIFNEIMNITAERDNFVQRPLSYYQALYDELHDKGNVVLFFASYNIDTGINCLKNKKKEILKKILTEKNESKLIDLEKINLMIDEELEKLELIKNKPNPIISATMLGYGGKEGCYLYGGSRNEYRELMPNYLIQWEMIEWTKKHGGRIYDLRGVSGDLSEENHLYGLYKFKRNFNPELCEYIGDFDLIIDKKMYCIIEKIRKSFIKDLRLKLVKLVRRK